LLLVDAGAATRLRLRHRTYPVSSGLAAARVYDTVLEVEIACLEATKKGNTVKQRHLNFQSSF